MVAIKMDFLNMTEMIEITSPEETQAMMKANRGYNKAWIGQESRECNLDDFEVSDGQNRYTVNHENVPFECLWLPHENKKLYVLFSGGRSANRQYPLFLRWKYQNALNGNLLCIDDPMYYFHEEYSHVMWYYGTNEVSYLKLLVDIVKKVMGQLSIEAKDVTFVGSSGGGYSALYCADMLDYSSAFAMNPTIILKNWYRPVVYNNFKKVGIDLEEDDKFGRNVLHLTNKTSTFMVVMNVLSIEEWNEQFTPFFKSHGILPKYGITQNDNIITWLHTTEYSELHIANPLQSGIMFGNHILNKVKAGEDITEFYGMSLLANEILSSEYELKDMVTKSETEKNTFYRFFVGSISSTVKRLVSEKIQNGANEKVKKLIDNDFSCNSAVWKNPSVSFYIGKQRIYSYRIIFNNGKFFVQMVVDNVSDYMENIADIKNTASEHDLMYLLTKNDTLIMSRVLSPISLDDIIGEFIDFTLDIVNKNIK